MVIATSKQFLRTLSLPASMLVSRLCVTGLISSCSSLASPERLISTPHSREIIRTGRKRLVAALAYRSEQTGCERKNGFVSR